MKIGGAKTSDLFYCLHGNTVITVKGSTPKEWGADWWSQCKDEIEEELANESEQ